ncbi:MAG: hypothetical protein IPL40_05870 [Proteobacteria bacterium]|nr:hypothetical protein [Pseudomonadota bacterium]
MQHWAPELAIAFERLWHTTLAYIPRVAAALVLLVVGWLVARLLRLIAFRLVRRLGAFGAVERELRAAGVDEVAPKVLAAVIFWIAFLLFVAAAGQIPKKSRLIFDDLVTADRWYSCATRRVPNTSRCASTAFPPAGSERLFAVSLARPTSRRS